MMGHQIIRMNWIESTITNSSITTRMPIFEYYCPDNHKIYSFFARSSADANRIPRCPDNPAYRLQKAVSAFAVTGRQREGESSGGGDMDDPRMEQMMAAMEKEMAGMDSENPDPRAMARMMRKMADMTGQKLPDSMQEMISRLEAGEDPEALEEAFGDMDDLEDLEPDSLDPDQKKSSKATKTAPPQRDPELYEMSDWL